MEKITKEKKTNPKVRFGLLREDEREIITKLKDKEKEIKILIEQLKALRQLLAQTANEMEIQEFEETLQKEKKEREKQIENLEDISNEIKIEIEKNKEEAQTTLYTGITANKINIAANENSIQTLYNLAYKSNNWNEKESKEFFEIRDAVFQVRNYDLETNISQTVNHVYNVLKLVNVQQKDQIQQNYKPQYHQENNNTINLPPINNNNTFNNISDNYKKNEFKIKPMNNLNNLNLTNKIEKSLDRKINELK